MARRARWANDRGEDGICLSVEPSSLIPVYRLSLRIVAAEGHTDTDTLGSGVRILADVLVGELDFRTLCLSLSVMGFLAFWTASSHSGKVSMPKSSRHVAKLPAEEGVRFARKNRKKVLPVVAVGR